MWEVVKESKVSKLHQPVLIVGLPGIGNVGKLCGDFLVEELKAKKIFSFFSYTLPQTVFVAENNLIELPRIEMYLKQFNGKQSAKNDLLFLVGDIQPMNEESSHKFCRMIIDLLKESGGKEIITLGGIGQQNVPEKPRVYCTGTDKEVIKQFTKLPAVEENIFGVVGPIMGISGLLPGLAKRQGLTAAILLAETFGHPMYLGLSGAKEILRVLNLRFSLSLDLQQMDKEINRIEKESLKRTKELEKIMRPANNQTSGRETSYIG